MAVPTLGPWMTGTITQKLLRRLIASQMGAGWGTFANSVSPTTHGGAHGVVGSDDLLVTISSGTTMAVASGAFFVLGASSVDQGSYYDHNNGSATISLNAHNTQARTDLVGMRVQDTAEDSSGLTQIILDKVTGTPGSGVPTAPAGFLVLAECFVPANSGAVVITDRRPWACALGGILRCTSTTRPTGVARWKGRFIFEMDTLSLLVCEDGTNWKVVYRLTGWTNVTFQNGWSNFGGGYANMQYRINGDNVELRGVVVGGTNPAVAFTLPVGFRPPLSLQFTGSVGGTPSLASITVASNGEVTILSSVAPTSVSVLGSFSTTA
jgi:hypothetical protein